MQLRPCKPLRDLWQREREELRSAGSFRSDRVAAKADLHVTRVVTRDYAGSKNFLAGAPGQFRICRHPLTMTIRLAAVPVNHPSAALLFVQILGILLYPLMEDTSAERALFGVFGLLVLGAALYVVKRGPWLTAFAVVLAVPVVILSIWLAFDFDPSRMVILAALEAIFYFYATGSLIAYMLEDEFASHDELFAAGATFTLLAWAFAYSRNSQE
jgi:hypothetical protein